MLTITSDEIKDQLQSILLQVAEGEEFLVMDQQKPTAFILPYGKPPADEVIASLKKLSQKYTLGKDISVDALREEGRK